MQASLRRETSNYALVCMFKQVFKKGKYTGLNLAGAKLWLPFSAVQRCNISSLWHHAVYEADFLPRDCSSFMCPFLSCSKIAAFIYSNICSRKWLRDCRRDSFGQFTELRKSMKEFLWRCFHQHFEVTDIVRYRVIMLSPAGLKLAELSRWALLTFPIFVSRAETI